MVKNLAIFKGLSFELQATFASNLSYHRCSLDHVIKTSSDPPCSDIM